MRKILSLLFLIALRSSCWSAESDVVVYGGTPGGITAAIAAARDGASVITRRRAQHERLEPR
jgi:ribulose 1,5-bisphosphate synthetase/thiazole synthase